jgi:hypothetical protein
LGDGGPNSRTESAKSRKKALLTSPTMNIPRVAGLTVSLTVAQPPSGRP